MSNLIERMIKPLAVGTAILGIIYGGLIYNKSRRNECIDPAPMVRPAEAPKSLEGDIITIYSPEEIQVKNEGARYPIGQAKQTRQCAMPTQPVRNTEKPAVGKFQKNYLENIIQRPVKNHNSISSRRCEYFVIHTTGSNNSEGAISWFNDPKSSASAHYVIDRDGQIIQTVADNLVAWHVRPVYDKKTGEKITYNARALGAEITGMPNQITQEQEDATVQLIIEKCNKYGIKKDHIVGHMELDPGRKPDPGIDVMKRIRARIPDNVGTSAKPKENHTYHPYIKRAA